MRRVPDLRFETVRILVDGDTAVFEWRMTGTNDGDPLPGAPAPSGRRVDLPGIDVLTTSGGRIAEVVGYVDLDRGGAR